MDEIEKRLRESTDACIKSFEAWVKASKSLESREALMEAMHEVRKVVSRVEIEIAISERDRLGSRPIPIPSHRSQRKQGGEEGGEGQEDYDFDDQQPQMSGGGGGGGGERRPQHHNRQRRPMHGRGGGGGGGNNNGNNGNSDNAQ